MNNSENRSEQKLRPVFLFEISRKFYRVAVRKLGFYRALMSLRYAPRYREPYSEAARASRLIGAVKTVKQLLGLVRVNIFAAV